MDWKIGLSTLGLCLLSVACGDDGAPAGESGSSGDDSTSTSTSTSSTTSTTSTSSTTSASGSGTTDTSTSSTTTGEETGSTGTTGAEQGVCIGLDANGYITSVLGLDGANVGGSCSTTPSACGGDLVGSWEFDNTCGEDNSPNIWNALCPGATQSIGNTNTVGTFEFGDDGTFTHQATTSLEAAITVNVDGCLGQTCVAFETFLNAQMGIIASCSGPDNDCDCSLDVTDTTNIMGTYEVANDEVILTVDGDELPAIPYCVNGDRLDLWTPQFQPTFTDEACTTPEDCEAALGDQNEFYGCDVGEPMNASLGPWTDLPLRR